MPMVIFAFLFDIGINLLTSLDSETLWHFDTARGLYVSDLPKSTGIDSGMIFSLYSFSIGWLWLTMCPLVLAIVEHRRGIVVSSRSVWQRAGSQTGPILVASILLWLLAIPGVMAFFVFTWKGMDVPNSPNLSSLLLVPLIIVVVVIYFAVNWSLCNQIIIIEDQQSATASLRRSSVLVRGIWGRAFKMCLLFALAILIFTSTTLGLTLFVFSLTIPEFALLREMLLSVKFLTLFCGGYARISFAEMPNFWTVCVMTAVNTLIHAAVAPVWAILTTYLYLERVDGQPENWILPT